MLNRLKLFLTNKNKRFDYLASKGVYNFLPDEIYLKHLFFSKLGYPLNLNHPRTFNEKIQWLKLYDRKPEYTMMVDKYEVKKYIANKIGKQYVIPTLGVWDKPEDINFDTLPDQFVLKCTHNSGLGMYICRDKANMDKKSVIKGLKKGLKENYYKGGREWPYKNVKPRIIAEKYMEEKGSIECKNFNSKPIIIQVDYNRFNTLKCNLYSLDWELINDEIMFFADQDYVINRPKCIKVLLNLLTDIPHVQTEFYFIDNKIYFGEITFHCGSGFEKYISEKFGIKMGDWLKLPSGGVLIKYDACIFYLRNQGDMVLTDYKLMCFNGKLKCTFTCENRFEEEGLSVTFYDNDWNRMPFERHYKRSRQRKQKPINFNLMKKLAEELSKDFYFMRIDFYEINGSVFFGEMTFHPGSGFEEFKPNEWDYKLGEWIKLPIDRT